MNPRQTLGVIGCGKMAFALLAGLVKSDHGYKQVIAFDVDDSRTTLMARELSVQPVQSNREVVKQADVVLLAVKPNQVASVLDEIRDDFAESKLVVSIAAGITTQFIEARLNKNLPVLRVMPNTPCLVGEGAIAVSPGRFATSEHLEVGSRMFAAVGKAVVVPESYLDAVTAVSGSGPAYVYLVAEAMTDAGVEIGLPRDLARSLVIQTIRGSIAMLEATGEHPAVLREQVTSPGGTTIAGLRQLEENGLRGAFFKAIRRAYERSLEMGKAGS